MLFACLICLIQWAHDVVRCNLLHTVDKVITDVSSTFHGDFHPFAFARSVAIVASEILARTNIGTKRTNAPMITMHRWSITFDFWSFEGEKKHGSNCMAGSTVSSTQSASLEDHKREEQYISVRTHVLFPSTIWVLEIWKTRWDRQPFLTSSRTSQS